MSSTVEASAIPTMRVTADRNSCCGYGTCVQICPEIYQLDRGLIVLTTELVPPHLEAKAIAGAESCPQAAIVLEKVDA